MRKELDYRELSDRFALRDEHLNDDWIEKLDELIRSESQLVGRQEWDSGNPGAGAGVIDVVQFRGVFISYDDVGSYGPYDSFAEAAEAVALFTENDATTSIWIAPQFEGTKRPTKQ
jgi:hypothetical protein